MDAIKTNAQNESKHSHLRKISTEIRNFSAKSSMSHHVIILAPVKQIKKGEIRSLKK